MKILEKISLFLFSIIMLIISIIFCLVIMNVVELQTISNYLENVLENEVVSRVVLIVAIVSIILAIKSLFFHSKSKKRQEIKTGVLLENKDGRLLISKDTIENLVNSVVKTFKDAIDVQTKVNLDVNNNITVFVSLLVKEEAIIKELSASIQTKIKETVKKSTDLDVNQININIKNIENSKKVEKSKNSEVVLNKKNNGLTKINSNNIIVNKNNNESNVTNQEIINNNEINKNIESDKLVNLETSNIN